jgi:hypothetical protein
MSPRLANCALHSSLRGTLDTYNLVWLGEDEEVVRRVSAEPRSANSSCGGVFAAACTQGKRDLVVRLERSSPSWTALC